MPELPEVKTVIKHLKKHMVDQTIKKVNIKLPKMLKGNQSFDSIIDSKITNIYNQGKFIIFDLSNNKLLISHLRMTGKYRTFDHKMSHDHLTMTLGNGEIIVYNDARGFGTFEIIDKENKEETSAFQVGPEPSKINANDLFKKLSKKRIAIKTSLLDQKLIAGLGNIYVNEVLWQTKILPTTPTNEITLKQLKNIVEVSAFILAQAYKMGGTTINDFKSYGPVKGRYQEKLKVHGKRNKLCPRCNKPIIYMKVNGRGTFYCEKCQV